MELTPGQAVDLLEHYRVGLFAGVAVTISVCPERGITVSASAPAGARAVSLAVDPLEGLTQAGANWLTGEAGLAAERLGAASDMLEALWALVVAEDVVHLAVHGAEVAIVLDDSARFRHPSWRRYGAVLTREGGPYQGRARGIAEVDSGRDLPDEAAAQLPVMDQLVVEAYAKARGRLPDGGGGGGMPGGGRAAKPFG
jgi:hypothetical protein